jgi:uncharacterized membrane protein YoaK (UPF0700 family)
MTALTADEKFDRVLRSLQKNSADFVRKERAKRNARTRLLLAMCVIFAAGVAVGALLVTALHAAA